MSKQKDKSDISNLLDIMAALRDPSSGCPWDLEQDFSTIAPHTIEEAFEVAERLAAEDCRLTFNMFSAPVGYSGDLRHAPE